MDPHCTWRLVLSFSNVEMGNGFKHLNIFKHRDVQICGLSCRKSMKMQGRELSYLKMCDSYQASFSSQMARLPNFAELSAAGINFGCPGHPVPSSHVSSPERPSLLRSSMGLLWEGQGKGLFCIKKLWLLPERNGNKNVSGHFRNSQVLLCTPWRPTNLICSGYFYAILETVMVWVTSVLKYYTRLLCFSSVPQQRYQGKAESFVVTVSSMLADAHFASVTFCKSLHPSAAVLPHKTRAKKTPSPPQEQLLRTNAVGIWEGQMPPRWGTVQVMSCCDSLVASRWSSRAWCSHEVVPVLAGDKTDTDNLSIVTISILILLSLFPKCNSRNAVKCHM